jgi:glutamine amidotransferase-like uncharacterized protein
MKRTIFPCLIITLIIGSCTQEKKSPIEGAWQLVQVSQKSGDKTTVAFPGIMVGGAMKMWTKEHFVFAGTLKSTLKEDTATYTLFGGGTYKLDGNKYEENMIFNIYKSSVNKKFKSLLEIRNDTLFIINGTDDNWNLPERYTIEKHVRIK